MPTALEIARGRQDHFTAGLFEAVETEVPLLMAFDARATPGTTFKSLARTGLPSSGFVNYGEGFTSSDAQLELREFACSLIGGLVKAEVITSERWDADHPYAGYSWFDLQTKSKIEADLRHIERQMIRGTVHDAKGFPGAKEMTPFAATNIITAAQSPASFNYKRTVLNAAGTTASTASSVYAFRFGDLDSQLILGGVGAGGDIIRQRERVRQMLAPDPVNAPAALSLHDSMQVDGHIGLSVAGFNPGEPGQAAPTQYALRRIANVTADSGKTLTVALMDKLSRMFGPGKPPQLFAMSERSGEQLAADHTPAAVSFFMGQSGDARNATYDHVPPPPETWRGVRIVYPNIDVIPDTDAIEAV